MSAGTGEKGLHPGSLIFLIKCFKICRHVPGVANKTQIFLQIAFLLKIIDLPGGQIIDPSSEKHYSLPLLPATPSSPSRALLPELQRYKDTVRCALLGAEVPGHRQQQLTQTLIVRLLKTHLCTSIIDFEKSTE